VQFIVKRDSARRFRFAALQSDIGQRLSRDNDLPTGSPSFIVLLENDTAWVRSDAVLRIARRLDGLWPAMTIFRLVPRVIRDWCYDFVAGRRYRWFGRKESCEIPAADWRDRFL
jgi:predicted DCC family thiol-disulfide oxidoreductase YuxK